MQVSLLLTKGFSSWNFDVDCKDLHCTALRLSFFTVVSLRVAWSINCAGLKSIWWRECAAAADCVLFFALEKQMWELNHMGFLYLCLWDERSKWLTGEFSTSDVLRVVVNSSGLAHAVIGSGVTDGAQGCEPPSWQAKCNNRALSLYILVFSILLVFSKLLFLWVFRKLFEVCPGDFGF